MVKKSVKKTKKEKVKISFRLKKKLVDLKKETDYKEEFKWTPKLSVNEETIDSQHKDYWIT